MVKQKTARAKKLSGLFDGGKRGAFKVDLRVICLKCTMEIFFDVCKMLRLQRTGDLEKKCAFDAAKVIVELRLLKDFK